jgi:hypothetical protein
MSLYYVILNNTVDPRGFLSYASFHSGNHIPSIAPSTDTCATGVGGAFTLGIVVVNPNYGDRVIDSDFLYGRRFPARMPSQSNPGPPSNSFTY